MFFSSPSQHSRKVFSWPFACAQAAFIACEKNLS
ncbi:hypothetical protein NC651_011743 [Populus alba x Populus x berolinensis]|nr:hypothetical protein NC651_011743 [Populus alba x Populus x berolinensis]